MTAKSFQDYYSAQTAVCYGCGRLNEHGLHIQSYWDGDEAVCTFTPKSYHTAIRGYVYGGLVASLIDCHSTGIAAAAMYRHAQRAMDTEPAFRFVTASLHVDYLKPTPLGPPLVVRARVKEIKVGVPRSLISGSGNPDQGRGKVIVESELSVKGEVCARGHVVAVQMPENLILNAK